MQVGLRFLLYPVGSNVVLRTACCSVGIVLPAYSTFKATEREDENDKQKWLMYWAPYGSFRLVEVFTDKLLSWFPMYYHAKFAFIVWLQLPTVEKLIPPGAARLHSLAFLLLLVKLLLKSSQDKRFVCEAAEKALAAMTTGTSSSLARRMMGKLDMYRKLTNALAVAVIVSVGWICYELYFRAHDVFNEKWENAWIIPAFWQVLSFSLLCIICAVWAPSQSAMRYAYSADLHDEFDKDDSSLTLIKPSPLPTNDIRSAPEAKPVQVSNVSSNGDMEEDKTE